MRKAQTIYYKDLSLLVISSSIKIHQVLMGRRIIVYTICYYLINKRYVIAIDGTQKFMRPEPWSEEPLERHVGKDKQEQYYVYVLEAVVIFEKGITLLLMGVILLGLGP
ncbi:hypothetical protein [Desulfosporosinus sp. I2]|uniref:hypothetical protein n=1 Tax=Desulfosporosinus sp. I2 TaxID=1617025 RepID=UPI0005EE7DE8|nr:hypothetical protein [Desulfosporosinus sp. I2]